MSEGRAPAWTTETRLNAGYDAVTSSHLAASVASLQELASLVGAKAAIGASAQYVRLGLVDHGCCLNPLLFGFAIMRATGQTRPAPKDPMISNRPAEHIVDHPAATAGSPLIYAIVANHPVNIQLEHTITYLARMVARQ